MATNDELRAAQKERASKYGIQAQDDGHLTPPAGYPSDPSEYADPVNYKYPVHDAAHAANAASRFAQDKSGYNAESSGKVSGRIKEAEKKFKVGEFAKEYDPNTGKDPDIDPPLSYAETHAVHFVSQLMKDKVYPFDQCVLDRKKDGYSDDSAKRICGAIKAGSVMHKSGLTVTKNEDGSVSWELEVALVKGSSSQEQTIHGVVYEPDTVDSQGDFADADEIRKACHDFMVNKRELGVMHKEGAGPRASIVENYIAPHALQLGNQQVKKGSWVMGVKVHDPELWDKVQKGEITGFSMGGRADGDTQ